MASSLYMKMTSSLYMNEYLAPECSCAYSMPDNVLCTSNPAGGVDSIKDKNIDGLSWGDF